jgi:hypothetical protein
MTFRAAAARLPARRRGKPAHTATLHRWRSKGLRGIRLQALRVGGVWMTTDAALATFFAQLSGSSLETHGRDEPSGPAAASGRGEPLEATGW